MLASLVALSIVAGVGFVHRQRRAAAPMVPPLLVANRTFSLANALTFIAYASLAALLFFLVLQLQTTLGFRPLVAGLAILPFPVMLLLLSARTGKLAGHDRASPAAGVRFPAGSRWDGRGWPSSVRAMTTSMCCPESCSSEWDSA
jgi:hypothetical protein